MSWMSAFACAYLATPYPRRITGGTVYVDGGANIRAWDRLCLSAHSGRISSDGILLASHVFHSRALPQLPEASRSIRCITFELDREPKGSLRACHQPSCASRPRTGLRRSSSHRRPSTRTRAALCRAAGPTLTHRLNFSHHFRVHILSAQFFDPTLIGVSINPVVSLAATYEFFTQLAYALHKCADRNESQLKT